MVSILKKYYRVNPEKIFIFSFLMLFVLNCNSIGDQVDDSYLLSAKTINSFSILRVDGVINELLKTIFITLPYGTDVTALVPTITYTGMSISPESGQEQDFTNPVMYTVTASDSSTQTYTVTVIIAPNDSLFISYSFEETTGTTIFDSSGNDNNGSLNGASRVVGKFGKAVAFPLSTSRIDIPQPPYNMNGQMSIECWFYLPVVSSSTDYSILTGYNYHELSLYIHNGKITLDWNSTNYINSNATIFQNQWYYLVITTDGNYIRLYINGTEDNSENISLPSIFSIDGYQIGSRCVYTGGTPMIDYQDNFTGTIDEFKWWKKILTASEILSNFNGI